MCWGLTRLGTSLIYFLLYAHVGDGVRGGRVWGRAERGVRGRRTGNRRMCWGAREVGGRFDLLPPLRARWGPDGAFPFSLFPSCGESKCGGV